MKIRDYNEIMSYVNINSINAEVDYNKEREEPLYGDVIEVSKLDEILRKFLDNEN